MPSSGSPLIDHDFFTIAERLHKTTIITMFNAKSKLYCVRKTANVIL